MSEAPAATPAVAPLLEVAGLGVDLEAGGGTVPVVQDLTFSIAPGAAVGLVGESGSGKSVTALALMGLLPRGMRLAPGGSLRLDSREMANLPQVGWQRVRGRQVSIVFQDPISSLDPAFTVGDQVVEAVRANQRLSGKEAQARAVELLALVGIPSPAVRMHDYPHQFSGGMAQRVLIAMAIAHRPRLLLADEPVTALDVTVRAQILELLGGLRAQLGMALVLVSHDLGVIAHSVDRVLVMYAGQVVEDAPVEALYHRPRHPYTEALLGARTESNRKGERLRSIPGAVPRVGRMPAGCRFAPRCGYATDACLADPIPFARWDQGGVRCIRADDLLLAGVSEGAEAYAATRATQSAEPLLVARNLAKTFPVRRGLLRREVGQVRAVDGVDLEIRSGETLGLVGESGSGKSTLGRLIVRLTDPTAGEMRFDGADLLALRAAQLRKVRRDIQIVFQNPYASLDPLLPAGESIAEPMDVHLRLTPTERRQRVADLLERVGLHPSYARRYPRALSGGQCQRVAIARALACHPRLIVCDEPVSALDVSSQAQVVNLLMDLQRDLGLSYLFISHDLSVVHHVSDRIAVMYLGRVVEFGSADQVYAQPRHPYTRALLSAALQSDPRARNERVPLRGAEPPSALSLPPGCRFQDRCPVAMDVCRTVTPPLVRDGEGGWVECHLFQ